MPIVSAQEIKYIQEVVGSLLYCGHGVDPTILVVLSAIAARQTIVSPKTVEAVWQILEYVVTYPKAVVFSWQQMQIPAT